MQPFDKRSFQIQKIKKRLGVGGGSHGSSTMTKKRELELELASAHTPYLSKFDRQLKRKYKCGCDLETLNSARAQTHDSSASRDNCTATTFWRAIP